MVNPFSMQHLKRNEHKLPNRRHTPSLGIIFYYCPSMKNSSLKALKTINSYSGRKHTPKIRDFTVPIATISFDEQIQELTVCSERFILVIPWWHVLARAETKLVLPTPGEPSKSTGRESCMARMSFIVLTEVVGAERENALPNSD